MINEVDANAAREEQTEFLAKKKAHSILVDEIEIANKQTFAVIAYFETKIPVNIPKNLILVRPEGSIKVPLITRLAPRMKL